MRRGCPGTGGGNAIYRCGGSIGIIGAACAGFVCAKDPDDETGQQRVFAPVKVNLAAEPAARSYHLVPGQTTGSISVHWDGASNHSASELLAPGSPEERADRGEAVAWLAAYLTDRGGCAPFSDVVSAARQEGIAERTLQRARKRPEVAVNARRRGFGQGSSWYLPGHSCHSCQPAAPGANGGNGAANADTPPGPEAAV